jgi:hypothetical protein
MGGWEDRKLKAESSRERFTAEDNWEAERVGSWEDERLERWGTEKMGSRKLKAQSSKERFTAPME